ncbi:MAG: hypothetical protein PHO14_05665 [Kiritimatiellae bacterium]|nr:hypothetical protein [Kiritimatiellia bacterium]
MADAGHDPPAQSTATGDASASGLVAGGRRGGRGGGHALAAGIRVTWSPSVFALPSPAGFSHSLRRDRARLAPPDQPTRPKAAFLETSPSAIQASPATAFQPELVAIPPALSAWPAPPVFPVQPTGAAERPRIIFSKDWDPRLFSGLDSDYAAWTSQAWTARVEMRFDGAGIPESVLLVQPSGLDDLDRRLTRSLRGWRLLDAAAPRQGEVTWQCPATRPPPVAESDQP